MADITQRGKDEKQTQKGRFWVVLVRTDGFQQLFFSPNLEPPDETYVVCLFVVVVVDILFLFWAPNSSFTYIFGNSASYINCSIWENTLFLTDKNFETQKSEFGQKQNYGWRESAWFFPDDFLNQSPMVSLLANDCLLV